jgi:hypothetical protein
MGSREVYNRPAGFAREPADERRKWVARIVLLLFVILVGWLLLNRVISPPSDERPVPTSSPALPGPL